MNTHLFTPREYTGRLFRKRTMRRDPEAKLSVVTFTTLPDSARRVRQHSHTPHSPLPETEFDMATPLPTPGTKTSLLAPPSSLKTAPNGHAPSKQDDELDPKKMNDSDLLDWAIMFMKDKHGWGKKHIGLCMGYSHGWVNVMQAPSSESKYGPVKLAPAKRVQLERVLQIADEHNLLRKPENSFPSAVSLDVLRNLLVYKPGEEPRTETIPKTSKDSAPAKPAKKVRTPRGPDRQPRKGSKAAAAAAAAALLPPDMLPPPVAAAPAAAAAAPTISTTPAAVAVAAATRRPRRGASSDDTFAVLEECRADMDRIASQLAGVAAKAPPFLKAGLDSAASMAEDLLRYLSGGK